jgi:pimeloyl-ACP methyl ester carboxylesterase
MNGDGSGVAESAEVGDVETALGADHQSDIRGRRRYRAQDRRCVLTDHAGEDPRARGQRVQRFAQREDRVHVGGRGPSGELRGLSGDQPPALEPVDDPGGIGTGHGPVGEDGSNRRRARLGERLNGRVHRLRGHRLEHVHGEPGFTVDRSAPDDRAADPRRRHHIELNPVLDSSGLDDHDRLAHQRPKRAREMVGVSPRQGGAAAGDLVGFDEESRHGSVHGAAPASRYGGPVAEVRLTARTTDGVGLSVVVSGDGDPLLLIPGLGAGRSAFDPIVPDLARAHRVITFDPRGIGESEGGANTTMTAMALDAVMVLDAAGVTVAAVFGASMGGLVAQHLVVDHSARVADLILAATSPGGDYGVDPRPEDQAALLGKGARTPEEAYRIACTVLYSPQFQRTHSDFIEAQIRERALHPVRPRVFSAQFNAMWQPDDSFERLAAVAVPALVLHGTEDVVTPFENARILAGQIPGARLRAFEGCGHLFFHERPAETARVVSEHVRRSGEHASQLSSGAGSSSPSGESSAETS